MKPHFLVAAIVSAVALVTLQDSGAQLFDSLLRQSSRIPLGDPGTDSDITPAGPKSLVTADFDGDGLHDIAAGNANGTITLLYGTGDGEFADAIHLSNGASTLRELVSADFDGDARPDIAAADPYLGELYIYLNTSSTRGLAAPTIMTTWKGARNLVADDFDGDGNQDIVIGGHSVGLRQLKGDGNGGFAAVGDISELNSPAPLDAYTLTPVYTLRSFRPPGSGPLPKLAATHAGTTTLWILGADATSGILRVEHTLFNDDEDPNVHKLHDFEIAPISGPLTATVPDLITVSKRSNLVTIWRGSPSPPYFTEQPYQQFAIPGGPRAVEVADTDHDGWGELAVVVRNFNTTLVYRNSFGLLVPLADLPSGKSPRDVVMPDLNGDGCADLAVINRKSQDLKVHLTDPNAPTGFKLPRQLYATDGDPSGLAIVDMNQDGLGDIIQLHRASGSVSIRLAQTDGSLAAAVHYAMGVNSNNFVVEDVNGDGLPDVSVVNLGREPDGGNLSVRLGDGAGNLGELRIISPPVDGGPNLPRGMFALVQADFDGDGILDQAVGYYDCQVTFYRGLGDGEYQATVTTTFVYESRVMVAADFDQDGDTDLAGAGSAGDFVVFVNNGDFFTNPSAERFDYNFGEGGKGNARSAVTRDINDDGDPDIVLGTSGGLVTLLGREGVTFSEPDPNSGEDPNLDVPDIPDASISTVASGDFDGDGLDDYAIACAENSRLQVHAFTEGRGFEVVLDIDVPSAAFVAAGDIDGDGLPDLAGTGSVLWTALSSASPPPAPLSGTTRPTVTGIVINEIIPKNDRFGVATDSFRNSDAVEIYNATGSAIDLLGWKLRLLTKAGETRDFTVASPVPFAPNQRLVFVCRSGESPLHTGYKLPAEGGKITLFDADSNPVDEVDYPPMSSDISLARYGDANATFYFNSYPDIGTKNLDNGVIDPDLKFLGISPASPSGDEPVQFFVEAEDDIGLALLGVYFQRLDGESAGEDGWVPLYDDGMHDDGGMLDGLFSGTLASGFPDGAQVEFYIRGIDLSDAETTLPDSPMFSAPGQPIRNYSVAVGSANDIGAGLQISEIVASNTGTIVDENGEADDWIELRNTGFSTIALDGFGLAQSTSPAPEDVLRFPPGITLAPGEYLIIWADDDTEQGPLHAPFKLSSGGELVALFGTTDIGVTAIAGSLEWPALEADEAFTVVGMPGESFERIQAPTPGAQNLLSPGIEILPSTDPETLTFVFPTGASNATGTGERWTLEMSTSLKQGTWQPVETGTLNGIERVHSTSMHLGERRFYRVRTPQN